MKLQAEHLIKHLQSQLLPVYLISSDEPLLVQETADKIRYAAKEKGFIERELLHGDKGDADILLSASETMSLFSDFKLFEFRLTKLPSTDLTKAFASWCENPSTEQCLLISCPKLDKKKKSTAWYKKIEQLGAHIEIWPIEAKQLPQWLSIRARAMGVNIDSDALNVLSDRVAGNLYAADQELRRLSLLYRDSPAINAQQMQSYVADNARFDSFELLEASFAGQAKKLTRILSGLMLEGEAPAKINGLLTYELRTVTKMAWDHQSGESIDRIIKKYFVWGAKKTGYSLSLARYSVSHWQRFLSRCLDLDKMIKGQQQGDPWVALETLLLQISGHALWKNS